MRHTMTRPAGVPLRAVIVALLLAGFGLWQAWNCTDGMMASLMAATTMTMTMDHDPAALPVHEAAAGHETDPGMPAGMAGLCISVLASFAAALMVMMCSPLKLLALLWRLGQMLLRPMQVPVRGPVLAQLCTSRT